MDFTYKRQDWPWVWALRETELLCLEWKEGCTAKELKEIEKLQNLLPTEIIDHVYIGTQLCAHNVDRLLKLGITHVLNVGGVTERGPVEEYKNNNIVYGELGANDTEGYPLLENHMTTAHAFIELARQHKPKEGICMVYCEGGLNRSGLVVAAETMMSGEMSVLEAVANLREKRGEYALCNDSFQEQLVALARSCDLLGEKPGTPGSLVEQTPPPEPEREIANPATTTTTTTTAAASTDESSSSSRIDIRVREPQQQSNAQSAATTPATPSATTPAGEKQRKPELVTPSPPTAAAPTTNSTRTAASSSSAVVVSSPEDNNDGGDGGVEEEVIEEEIILEDEYEEEVIGHVEEGEEEEDDVVEYDEEEVILEEDDDEYVVEEEVVLPDDEENKNSGKMVPPAWGYESEYLEVEVLDYEIVSPSSRQNKVNKDLAYMWDWDPNVRSPRSPSSPTGTANNTNNNSQQQQKQPQRVKGKGGNNNNNNKARRHSSSEGDLDYILEWTPGDSPPKSPTAKQKIDENNTKVPQLEKLVEEPTEVEGSDG